MKRNVWKKMTCLSLSAVMLFGAVVTDTNEAAAAGEYDATITITTPKAGEAPQAPAVSGVQQEYELLGYAWEDACGSCESSGAYYFSDSEFMEWYLNAGLALGGDIGNQILKKFENGHAYTLTAFAKISGLSLPRGGNGDVTCIDGATSETIGTGNCDLFPVSGVQEALPEGFTLPSCLAKGDSLAVINDVPKMECAPKGHSHILGSYRFDDTYHWKICAECGVALSHTRSEHSTSLYDTESWTVTKAPTETETGLWKKRCSNGCGYDFDRVVVPCLNDQTIVSSYDELRDALAKGGKQWITIDCPGSVKWIVQEDMTAGNTLKVSDPDADITIDMNGCGISRETGKYEKALFEIEAGKLRILSRSCETPSSDRNLSFKSFSPDYTLFRVYKNGSLRLTNVSGTLPDGEHNCGNPSVITEGDLQIDGGNYENHVKDFDPAKNELATCILIKSGKTEINGGTFTAQSCAVASLGGKLTIHNGKFGAWDEAVYIKNEDTETDIYGGSFDRMNSSYDWYQDCGVYVDRGFLNIYGGDFYGDVSGVRGSFFAKNINIYDGYFRLRGAGSLESSGAFSFDPASCKVTIYNGTFSGKKGITFYSDRYDDASCSCALADHLYNGGRKHAVNDGSQFVDINQEAASFGMYYLTISCKTPYFLKHPESVVAYTGDEIVFTAKAGNAARYEWSVIDVDSGQPYAWDDLKQYHAISTNGETSDTLVIKNINGWFDGKGVICEAFNDNGWAGSDAAYLTVRVRGDVNSDGVLDISDMVMMQKWLLKKGELTDAEAGDMNRNGTINIFDLCLMKQMLMKQ